MSEGAVSNALRGEGMNPSYIPSGDPGTHGGGTYTAVGRNPGVQHFEEYFGPSARDIKEDPERHRRRQRWHLPDALQGSNPWLADRIDGLVTDTTASPFTTLILPYKHIDNVDGKIKWNVWSYDEGMASRVPYEASARVLTQTKRSFAGYTVRQGLAIVLEANFMMSQKGREDFDNQLRQMLKNIEATNNADVTWALLVAPSYQKHVNERYWDQTKSPMQQIRDYIELFGFLAKNPNALDIAIEEAKEILRSWGGKEPDFLLCNSKLTMQLTMTPERTQYFTQGYDGIRRLRQGPNIAKYRGLNVIHSHSFALETGARPRDLLTRRVRVGEYYRINPCMIQSTNQYQLYDESRDTWFSLCYKDLIRYSATASRPNITWHCCEADDRICKAEGVEKNPKVFGLYLDIYDLCVKFFSDVNPTQKDWDENELERFASEIKLNLQGKQISDIANFPSDDDTLPGCTALKVYARDNAQAVFMKLQHGLEQIFPKYFCGDTNAEKKFNHQYIACIFTAFVLFCGRANNNANHFHFRFAFLLSRILDDEDKQLEFVLLRPNIEHNMYGVILGKGGSEDLGSTLWGQTQLECYSDSVHGIWGMSYKYNERAIVFNEKNLIRLWDIAYASYSGGKDSTILDWNNLQSFETASSNINTPYVGPSLLVMGLDRGIHEETYEENWSSPVAMVRPDPNGVMLTPENDVRLQNIKAVMTDENLPPEYDAALNLISDLHLTTKCAGEASNENLAGVYGSMYFQGTLRTLDCHGRLLNEVQGSGHHGPDYVGVASKRNGKGVNMSRAPGIGVFASA